MTSIKITKDDGSLKTLVQLEKEVIIAGIETHENLSDLAKKLGIGRSTLYRKIEDYDLKKFVEKARERFHSSTIDEKKSISKAMLGASNINELCHALDMDRSTLAEKLEFHGLIFVPRTMSYTDKLAADRKRHEAAGTLHIQC